MRVQIATRHCDVPEPIVGRMREQLERLTRYDARVSSAEVTFTEEKRTRAVEVVLHVDRVNPIVARGEADDFGVAVSKVLDRLRRMVRDQHERHRDHQAPNVSQEVTGG